MEDGADWVVVLAIVHGEVQHLVRVGEHRRKAEAGTQRVRGLETGIAHCDVERICVIAVADAVDEVGTVGRVSDATAETGLFLQAVGQFQFGRDEQEVATGEGVEPPALVVGLLMPMGEVKHGLCAEFALRKVCFKIERVTPCVIVAAQAVGEVERIGTVSLLVSEVIAVIGLPSGHRRQVLAKGMSDLQAAIGCEVVIGCVIVLAVGLRRSALEILVQARRFAVALLVVVCQRSRCPEFGLAEQ